MNVASRPIVWRRAPVWRRVVLALALLVALARPGPSAADERGFPQTGEVVRGAFLDFFDANGGLEIFGYPRSGEFELNGHTVQYFQRARMEYWPENRPGDQVQLGLLGVELGKSLPPSTQSSDPDRRYFEQTQHSIGGAFRSFFELRGGIPLFGYPITDEVRETGRIVQYFQRARFEWHPELPEDRRVQLGLIGDEALALGTVAVPAAAAPKIAPTLPPPVPNELAGPGKLLVSTGAGRDFYLMNANGTDVVPVGRGIDPSISPDGATIVYASQDEPAPGLYALDANGGPPRLVYAGRDVRRPVVSPTGLEIAFDEKYRCIRVVRVPFLPVPFNQEDECFRIKVVPTAGGQDWLPAGQSGYATSPSWSPDGSRLLFKDEKALYVVSRKEDARQLSAFQPLFFTPTWSPRGGQIAVALDQNRDRDAIALVPDDGGVATRVLTPAAPHTDPPFNPPDTNLSPAWSPDGTRIAFASNRDGALRVWLMQADGSRPTRVSDLVLVSNNAQERLVSWGGR